MPKRYCKIPPAIAAKINLLGSAPEHPDGWRLITIAAAVRLIPLCPPRPDGRPWTAGEAVIHFGGVMYDSQEAIASANGEQAYMMQPEPLPEQAATIQEELPEEPAPEAGAPQSQDEPSQPEDPSQDQEGGGS